MFARILLLLAAQLATVASGLQGQDLVTDRPDQTESAETVPLGQWQLEVGATFEWNESDTLTLPGTLIRWGIAPRFELRLGWEGLTSSMGSKAAAPEGAGDGEIGGKIVLHRSVGATPQLALLFASSVPWGDADLTSDHFDPSFRFALDQEINDRLGFGVNLGVEWESDPSPGARAESHWVYTAVVGVDLASSTGAFFEVYGREPADAEGPGELSLDGGVTWLITPDVQLDLAVGVGLTSSAPDAFVGAGVSVRK